MKSDLCQLQLYPNYHPEPSHNIKATSQKGDKHMSEFDFEVATREDGFEQVSAKRPFGGEILWGREWLKNYRIKKKSR